MTLSLGTDQALHVLRVYPPWGQPMHPPWLNLLALHLGPSWYPIAIALSGLPLTLLGGLLYMKTTTRRDREIG